MIFMSIRKPNRAILPVRWIVPAVMLLATLLPPLPGHAQTEVLPGESVTLAPFDYSECSTQTDLYEYLTIFGSGTGTLESVNSPTVSCDTTNAAAGALRVRAGSGLLFAVSTKPGEVVLFPSEDPIRYGFAIGRIGTIIRIPAPGIGEVGAEVLATQISTEIDWAGLLWNRKPSIPSWTQVVGTLQVRDLTTGLVVASNTFLNERLDLENNLPTDYFSGALNAFFGWTTVRASTGADLTAQLLRGRDFRIEIEAKCEDLGPILLGTFQFPFFSVIGFVHGGGCFFGDTADTLIVSFFNNPATRYNSGGGFHVGAVTVTVQDDVKAELAEVLENLDRDGDGVRDDVDVCLDTVLPEGVPTRELKPNRYALVDGDRIFDTVSNHDDSDSGSGDDSNSGSDSGSDSDSDSASKGGRQTFFTLDDTAGCSCEQIIEELDLGDGHVKFGCSIGAMRNWVDGVTP